MILRNINDQQFTRPGFLFVYLFVVVVDGGGGGGVCVFVCVLLGQFYRDRLQRQQAIHSRRQNKPKNEKGTDD